MLRPTIIRIDVLAILSYLLLNMLDTAKAINPTLSAPFALVSLWSLFSAMDEVRCWSADVVNSRKPLWPVPTILMWHPHQQHECLLMPLILAVTQPFCMDSQMKSPYDRSWHTLEWTLLLSLTIWPKDIGVLSNLLLVNHLPRMLNTFSGKKVT